MAVSCELVQCSIKQWMQCKLCIKAHLLGLGLCSQNPFKDLEGDHVRLHLSPGHDRDWHLGKQAGHIKLLSLPLCNELMVELHRVLFLQQIWVCQQHAFGCVWESDNSSQLTQQSLQREALSVSVSPAIISLSKLNLAANCPQNWAGPPPWRQLKPLTQGTQAWEPGPS